MLPQQSQSCFSSKLKTLILCQNNLLSFLLIKEAEHLAAIAMVARWTWTDPSVLSFGGEQIDVGTLKVPESMSAGGRVMGRCGGLFSAWMTQCWGTQHSWRDLRPFIRLPTSFFTSPCKLELTFFPARKEETLVVCSHHLKWDVAIEMLILSYFSHSSAQSVFCLTVFPHETGVCLGSQVHERPWQIF